MLRRLFTRHRGRLQMLREWARHDANTFRVFLDTLHQVGADAAGKRILDIGCGANAPMTVALHAAGDRVTGIDHKVGHRWGLGVRWSRYAAYVKEAGVPKTLRKALGEVVYDRHYYRFLGLELGLRLTEDGLDLREMSAEKLEFDDSTFDIVHSNATWEHLPDVATANAEVARVLKPGGLAYIEIHLFRSLSGGHDLEWIVPGRNDIPIEVPWRHLRDPEWTAPVYLNRLREDDYHLHFTQTPGLEILSWQTEYSEGEHLLTKAILDELPEYRPDELTKRSVIVVARRHDAGRRSHDALEEARPMRPEAAAWSWR
jgi:SAM-dependent methyltransferase